MHNQQSSLEPAEVIKRLFTSAESRPDGEYQGEYDRNTDDRKVKIVFDLVFDDKKRSCQADD
jgi:major membrane immunogen (membrane-anchored lipoprotein)